MGGEWRAGVGGEGRAGVGGEGRAGVGGEGRAGVGGEGRAGVGGEGRAGVGEEWRAGGREDRVSVVSHVYTRSMVHLQHSCYILLHTCNPGICNLESMSIVVLFIKFAIVLNKHVRGMYVPSRHF